jgi:dipicolinate synthase subunit B
MRLADRRIGYAVTGSHCTLERAIAAIDSLTREGAEIFPIMSPVIAQVVTRFGGPEDWIAGLRRATGREPWTQIPEVEPIGPQKLLDALVIAPCTGSTLSKLANAQTDTTVCMAAKAMMRNHRPVVLAVTTNDALGLNAYNLAKLLNQRDMYFVPLGQDNPHGKPNSLDADLTLIPDAVVAALEGRQVQPLLVMRT